jgi:molecular chaperone DnaJ
MPSDYYLVLGIERGADISQIKHAYRQTIKRHHPDMGGGSTNPSKFIEARKAYEVLSDFDKRRAYDAQLKRRVDPVRTSHQAETIHRRPTETDLSPLRFSYREDAPQGFGSVIYPSHHDTRRIPKDLYLEIVLSPQEARRGGKFPITIPVPEDCPQCRQNGAWDRFLCPSCWGYGAVRAMRTFNLTIPSHTRAAKAIAVPLDHVGLEGMRLVIDLHVGGFSFG